MMRSLSLALLFALGLFSGTNAAEVTCDCTGIPPVTVDVDGSCPSSSEVDSVCRSACASEGLSFESADCSNDCLGEDTLLYSCTQAKYIPAREVQVGDAVRAVTAHGPVCSDVYYKFQHQGKYAAYSLTVEGAEDEPIVVSANHLLYVGQEFGSHEAIRAKKVQVGDTLITSNGVSKKVVAIDKTITGLVNVLTMEPALELQNGTILSAHSYDESLYGYTFLPFKLMYKALGPAKMDAVMKSDQTKAGLESMDYYMGYGIDALSLS